MAAPAAAGGILANLITKLPKPILKFVTNIVGKSPKLAKAIEKFNKYSSLLPKTKADKVVSNSDILKLANDRTKNSKKFINKIKKEKTINPLTEKVDELIGRAKSALGQAIGVDLEKVLSTTKSNKVKKSILDEAIRKGYDKKQVLELIEEVDDLASYKRFKNKIEVNKNKTQIKPKDKKFVINDKELFLDLKGNEKEKYNKAIEDRTIELANIENQIYSLKSDSEFNKLPNSEKQKIYKNLENKKDAINEKYEKIINEYKSEYDARLVAEKVNPLFLGLYNFFKDNISVISSQLNYNEDNLVEYFNRLFDDLANKTYETNLNLSNLSNQVDEIDTNSYLNDKVILDKVVNVAKAQINYQTNKDSLSNELASKTYDDLINTVASGTEQLAKDASNKQKGQLEILDLIAKKLNIDKDEVTYDELSEDEKKDIEMNNKLNEINEKSSLLANIVSESKFSPKQLLEILDKVPMDLAETAGDILGNTSTWVSYALKNTLGKLENFKNPIISLFGKKIELPLGNLLSPIGKMFNGLGDGLLSILGIPKAFGDELAYEDVGEKYDKYTGKEIKESTKSSDAEEITGAITLSQATSELASDAVNAVSDYAAESLPAVGETAEIALSPVTKLTDLISSVFVKLSSNEEIEEMKKKLSSREITNASEEAASVIGNNINSMKKDNITILPMVTNNTVTRVAQTRGAGYTRGF